MTRAERDDADDRLEEERYVEELVTRGEAAELDERGELPPGATHEIVERHEDGSVRVERRRFSLG